MEQGEMIAKKACKNNFSTSGRIVSSPTSTLNLFSFPGLAVSLLSGELIINLILYVGNYLREI